MKIILGGFVLSVLFPVMTFAYSPTLADRDWLDSIEERVDELFPTHITTLVRAYDTLEAKKVQMKIAGGNRGVYLAGKLKEFISKKIFEQSNVCITNHAQLGDTVELMYTVKNEAGADIRVTTSAFAFNVGSNQVWKSLSENVYGLQEGYTSKRIVKSVGVDAGSAEIEMKSFTRSTVEQTSPTELFVGQEFTFGSPEHDAVIMGKIVTIDDQEVVFDFVEAAGGRHVSLYTTLNALNKACTSQ